MINSSITFIVPCYNEEARLSTTSSSFFNYFNQCTVPSRVIFVNDGSKDHTEKSLEQMITELNRKFGEVASLVSYHPNGGKGWALKKGIKEADTDWCLTLDADMAAEPSELMQWLSNGLDIEASQEVVIGSREKGIEKHTVKSSWIRRNIGLTFNSVLRIITGLKFRDTQCGFKLYRTPIAKEVFSELLDYGFAHDVEVLLKLKKMNITVRSMPLKWEEKPGSKVSIVSDSFKMLKTVILLRSKYALNK